jgi:hypothetical protein
MHFFNKITQDFREQDLNHSLMFDPVGGGILKCLALFSLFMQGLIAKGAVATKEAPLQSLSITNSSILPTFLSIPSCTTWLIYAPSCLQKLASAAHWFIHT